MKITFLILTLVFSTNIFGGGISDIIPNIQESRDIVLKHESVLEYFGQLKVVDTNIKLNSLQRYELARKLLDIHHLCSALYHQGYYLELSHPVLKLALTNFPGLKKHKAEMGLIYTGAFKEYFESNLSVWSVSGS